MVNTVFKDGWMFHVIYNQMVPTVTNMLELRTNVHGDQLTA
jgi:hypothetical protein